MRRETSTSPKAWFNLWWIVSGEFLCRVNVVQVPMLWLPAASPRSNVKEREVRRKRSGGKPPDEPLRRFGGSPGIVMIQYFNIIGSSGSFDSPRHGSLCRAPVGASCWIFKLRLAGKMKAACTVRCIRLLAPMSCTKHIAPALQEGAFFNQSSPGPWAEHAALMKAAWVVRCMQTIDWLVPWTSHQTLKNLTAHCHFALALQAGQLASSEQSMRPSEKGKLSFNHFVQCCACSICSCSRHVNFLKRWGFDFGSLGRPFPN